MDQEFGRSPASPSLLEPTRTPEESMMYNNLIYKDDTKLYMEARALLDEMVRAGNPASKDHRSLLSDVEEMVSKIMNHRRNSVMPAAQEADPNNEYYSTSGFMFDGILDEQIWYDMDWESILRGWTEIPHT